MWLITIFAYKHKIKSLLDQTKAWESPSCERSTVQEGDEPQTWDSCSCPGNSLLPTWLTMLLQRLAGSFTVWEETFLHIVWSSNINNAAPDSIMTIIYWYLSMCPQFSAIPQFAWTAEQWRNGVSLVLTQHRSVLQKLWQRSGCGACRQT